MTVTRSFVNKWQRVRRREGGKMKTDRKKKRSEMDDWEVRVVVVGGECCSRRGSSPAAL